MTTSNKIALNQALVDELVTFQKNIRENTSLMAQRAFQIRSEYLSADGLKYDPAFEKWWSAHNLSSVFGQRANFTKWAAAGEVVEQAKVAGYSDRLPTAMTALYELSQLTPDEIKLSVQDTYTRDSLTDDPKGKEKPSPLIHPEVTAVEIKSWRKQWRNPKPKSTQKSRLPSATIALKVRGFLTIEKLKEIHDALINSMKPFGEYVLLETTLDDLIEGHRTRQEHQAVRDIQYWIIRRYSDALYGSGSFNSPWPKDAIAMQFLKAKHYLEDDEETGTKYFKELTQPTNIEEGNYDDTSGVWVMTIPVQDQDCPIWDAAAHIHGLKRDVITVPRTVEALQRWIEEGSESEHEWLASFLLDLENAYLETV